MARNNDDVDGKDYNELALEGCLLILNNQWNKARSLFMTHRDQSVLMSSGSSMVCALEYFLSGSRSRGRVALQSTLETINKCRNTSKVVKKSTTNPDEIFQCILNDLLSSHCQVSHSIVSIMSGSDVVSSCWNIKQVWQQHRKLYKEFLNYAEHINKDTNKQNNSIIVDLDTTGPVLDHRSETRTTSNDNCINESETKTNSSDSRIDQSGVKGKTDDVWTNINKSQTKDAAFPSFPGFSQDFVDLSGISKSVSIGGLKCVLDNEPMRRRGGRVFGFLKSSKVAICGFDCTNVTFEPTSLALLVSLVSFGYALFLLAIQHMPQSSSFQMVMHLLGFHDDQGSNNEGVMEKLMVSSLSDAFVAPFSCCLLLHCLCSSRRFMVMNSNNFGTMEEIEKIELLLDRFWNFDKENSTFYYYFKGKSHLIKGQLNLAGDSFKMGVNKGQNELKLMCLNELCKTMLIKFDWKSAGDLLDEIRQNLPSMYVYHTYLTAISFGAAGDMEAMNQLMKIIVKYLKQKQKESFEFFGKRLSLWESSKGEKLVVNKVTCKLFCFEILYLWNLLHVCSSQQLCHVVTFCQENKESHYKGLCCLLIGASVKFISEKKKNNTNNNKKINNNINNNNNNTINGTSSSDNENHAEKMFMHAFDAWKTTPEKTEDHIFAFAAYELGYVKLNQGDYKTSKDFFTQAKHFDQRHIFFKSRMESESEKLINSYRASKKQIHSNSFTRSDGFLDRRMDSESIGNKSFTSKIFNIFFPQEKVTPLADPTSAMQGFLSDISSEPKLFSRNSLIKIGGDGGGDGGGGGDDDGGCGGGGDDDGGCGGGGGNCDGDLSEKEPTITKGCVIQ